MEWLREHEPAEQLQALLPMCELFPTDGWVRRELAIAYTRQLDFEAALSEARAAIELEPSFSWSWSTAGYVYMCAGKFEEARTAIKRAIQFSVDNDSAIAQLLDLSHTASDRFEAIVFIYEELSKQVTLGHGLVAWRERAAGILDPVTLLHALMEVLEVRPDLWQAWIAVAKQLSDLAHLERAAVVVSQAKDRFPLLPDVWLEVAEICRRRFDSVGQRGALERALQINPRLSAAVQQLAESYEREQNFEKSRQLLEELLAHSPLDAINHGWYAAILWRLNRQQEAIDHVKRAVQLNPGYDWAWNRLADWGAKTKQPQLAQGVAEELTNNRPGEARSWLILARLQAASGDRERALDTLRRAIKLNPQCTPAYDLSAELLVRLNRYDEALALCDPPAFGGTAPLELRGRCAWVHSCRGELSIAISVMEKVIQESPGYFWGLEQLADWYERTKQWDDYHRISERMVQVAPFSAIGYGYRGMARLKTGDRASAKADWSHAIHLDPAYTYGALSLADLHLEDDELDLADAVLKTQCKIAPSDFVTARSVRLACLRGDREGAQRLLIALCRSNEVRSWPIRTASDEFSKTFGQRSTLSILKTCFGEPGANPETVVLLVEAYARRGAFGKCRRSLNRVRKAPVAWRRGSASHMRALAQNKKRISVWWFTKLHRAALREETWSWGCAAEALSNLRLRSQVLKWCVDWRERKEITPRMLFFLAINARYRFHFKLAHEVQQCALRLPPDGWDHIHRLLELVDDFAEDRLPADAEQRLAQINPDSLGEFYRDMRALAKTWIEIMSPSNLSAMNYFEAAAKLQHSLGKQSCAFQRAGPFGKLWHTLLANLATSRGQRVIARWHNFRASVSKWV